MHCQLKVKPPEGTKKTKKMNATKKIKNAVELELNLTKKDYEVVKMAHIYGDEKLGYDVAVINITVSNDAYIVRVWERGSYKVRQIKPTETYQDALISFINLTD